MMPATCQHCGTIRPAMRLRRPKDVPLQVTPQDHSIPPSPKGPVIQWQCRWCREWSDEE